MVSKRRFQSRKSLSRSSSGGSRRLKTASRGIFALNHKAALLIPQGELDLFHYMVDQIGDEVMVLDKQARIVFANEAAVKGLGYQRRNILYRPLTDFFQDRISVRQWQKTYLTEVKKKRRAVSHMIKRVVKGGKVQTIDVTAVYMRYKSKDYVLAVGRDITEQLAFQARLRESEDRYRLLSEQAAEGILMVDLKGVILYANKAAGQMVKIPPSKMVGTHVKDYMDRSSLHQAVECFRKVSGGSSAMCSDVNIKDKTSRIIPAEFTVSPIFKGHKVAQIHVIFRDMRRRKEMEVLRRESEKTETLQHFIAGTTQEILQPLRGLLEHSQSLTDRYRDRHFEYIGFKEFEDIMKTLQTMNDQVKYCFDTTERLLSLYRREAKLEGYSCNVNDVIREAVDMLKQSLAVSDIKMELRLSARLPRIAISAFDLRQVLNNVLTNAVQSLPDGGGTIRIKTARQTAAGAVRIDCRDDGVGIPKEILARVFEPFFTTKPRGLEKSSGLGLSIAHSIVKAHQGDIVIKSDFRQGTLVTIVLPVHHPGKRRKPR